MKANEVYTIIWVDGWEEEKCIFIKSENGFLLFRKGSEIFPVKEANIKKCIKRVEK